MEDNIEQQILKIIQEEREARLKAQSNYEWTEACAYIAGYTESTFLRIQQLLSE